MPLIRMRHLSVIFASAIILVVVVLVRSLFAHPWDIGSDHTHIPPNTPVEFPKQVELSVPDTTLTIKGCASPNAFVTLFDDNTPIGTVIADADGRFTKKLGSQTHGLHNIRGFFEDGSDRTSSTSSQNISVAPHANTDLNVFLPPTLTVNNSVSFQGEKVTFSGSTIPNAKVRVFVDGNSTFTAVANDKGNWFVIIDTYNYFVGTHTFQALSEGDAKSSPKTDKFSFKILAGSGAEEPLAESPDRLEAPVINSPDDGYLTGSPGVLITGTSPINIQLEIFVDGYLAGSVFSNARGEWNFPFSMTGSQHTILAKACINGSCSVESNQITIYYQGDFDGCKLNFRLLEYRFFNLNRHGGIDLDIEVLSGLQQHEMIIDWGDTTIEHLTLYRLDDVNRFHHVFNEIGQFNGSLTIQDSNDCISTQYFSASVVDDTGFNWWWALPIGIFTVLLFMTTARLSRKEEQAYRGRRVVIVKTKRTGRRKVHA